MSAVDTLIANLKQYETSVNSQPVICVIATFIAALQFLEGAAGTAYQFNTREITVDGVVITSPVQLLATDGYVDINNTSGAAVQLNMPASPGVNQRIVATDISNTAGASNITLNSGGTLDTINVNAGWSSVHWNSTAAKWIVSA